MKKFKGWLLVLAMGLIIGSLAGCGGDKKEEEAGTKAPVAETKKEGETKAAEGQEDGAYGFKIGGCAIDMSSPLFVALVNASEEMAERYGCSIVWKSGEGSLEKQIDIVENYIEQGMDVIMIDPLDAEGMAATIEKAQKAGIKTITMGNYVKAEGNVSTVYNDVVDVASCVELMVHMQGEDCKLAGIMGTQGNYSSDRREEGFLAGCEKFPNVTSIIGYCDYTASVGATAAQDMLAANKDIAGMWIVDDTVAYAVQEVISSAGLSDNILVMCLCGMDEAVAKVDSGEIFGTNLLGGARLGYYNTSVAIQMCLGEEFDEIEYFPCPIVVNEETLKIVQENQIGTDSTWMTPADAYKTLELGATEFLIEE
ncbi:MAG: sugar ABC transporter substrate-binding protein [Lachnospiraceae bacterium]|jgi:ribose transport system substrate-binding protein|nr:sugar ABC transporter substrate-binding protein [Lachnospiraceae bacterium]